MDEEWSFHLAERTTTLMASGLPRAAAAAQARREFGDPLRWTEQAREARGRGWLHDVAADIRDALRQMRRAPAFAFVAMTTLALGIGANTAIFSIVNGLLLRPLPVADPHRLVTIGSGTAQTSTYAIWDEIRQRSAAFDGVLAWSTAPFNLSPSGEMEPVGGMFVSGDFFNVLGVPPLLGRTFTPADDVRGGGSAGPVDVISHRLWQRRFAGAADVVGKSLNVNGVSFAIIGVTPPAFVGVEVGQGFDVALPFGTEPLSRGRDTMLDQRSRWWLNVMLRLKRGQSLDAAEALLRAMQPQIREAAMPDDGPPQSRLDFLKTPFTIVPASTGVSVSGLRERYERPLLIVLAIVGVVLTIACVNLANLLMARAAAREHELSVRLALGASRWRLARQLFVESVTLAAIGAACGLVVAAWGSRALVAQISSSVNTVSLDLSFDWRTLSFTALATIAAAAFSGTAPALRAARAAPSDALKSGRAEAGDRRGALSSSLVVGQVALSLVLVIAAGLFVRTFAALQRRPVGFDKDSVLIVNVNASRAHPDSEGRLSFLQRLVDAAGAAGGVAAAAGSAIPPILGSALNVLVDRPVIEGADSSERRTLLNVVTPRWFTTYGMQLRAGRDIDPSDSSGSLPVVVVNEAFGRRFLPGRDPVGETIAVTLGGSEQSPRARQIVGVAADAPYRSLRDDLRPTIYVPLAQWTAPFPLTGISIGVRTAGGAPSRLVRPLTSALTGVDPDLSFNFRLFQEQVAASVAQERLVAILSGSFGALALFLAALGLYGVVSYSVSRRRSEIGLRLALGAPPGVVVRLVLRRLSLLVAIGIAVGGVASLWASQLAGPILYGLEPRDPATFLAAIAILVIVAVIAGWLPARRASQMDPAETLRMS